MAGLTDDQLKALTDAEMRQSVGYFGGKLAEMRRKAEYYFLGLPKGDLAPPEIEGRSNVVDTTVRDTILWMQPQLIKTFCAGDKVVEFAPTSADDEDKAKLATDYINYLFYKQNPGFQIVSTWFTDALLQKVGILKVYWDNRVEESREEYKGLDDVEMAQLLDDEEVEPIEHKEYPDEEAAKQKQQALEHLQQQLAQAQQAAQQNPQAAQAVQQLTAQLQQTEQMPVPNLHNVTVKRSKKGGRIRVENVPPEEFLISRKAKSIAEAPFVGHRVMRTVSDLNAMGYKNVDQISSDENSSAPNMEVVERVGYDDEQPYLGQESSSMDPSQRVVWITECYLKADVDGDGIAEWRKVVRAGNQILENEPCDGPPFVSITPVPLPHRFFGMSIADLAMESQRIKTSLVRAQLDNLYLQVNGRYFAVEGQVNLDDLLTSRPGGVVRVKQSGAVGRLDQAAADSGHGMEMIQYFEDRTENATGWTKYSQGGDSDSLNKTATGINVITNRGDLRTDLIARQFAETGFTDLFRLILKLVCQHQDKKQVLRLGDKWVDIDPREWRNQFDLQINVGLGTGNKDQQVQHLMMMHQLQGQGLQIGITTPENMFNSAAKLSELLGFKNPEKYWTDPAQQPPQQPKPDPEMAKAQMQAQTQQQIEASRLQFEQQKAQIEMQQEREKAQLDAQVAMATQQAQAQQAHQQNELEAQREQMKFEHEMALKREMAHNDMLMKQQMAEKQMAFDKWKAELESNTKIMIAQITAQQANTALAAAEDRADRDMTNGN